MNLKIIVKRSCGHEEAAVYSGPVSAKHLIFWNAEEEKKCCACCLAKRHALFLIRIALMARAAAAAAKIANGFQEGGITVGEVIHVRQKPTMTPSRVAEAVEASIKSGNVEIHIRH